MNSKWEAIVGRSNGKRPPDKCCNSIQTIAHTSSFWFLFLQPTQTNTVWLAKIKSIHRAKWEEKKRKQRQAQRKRASAHWRICEIHVITPLWRTMSMAGVNKTATFLISTIIFHVYCVYGIVICGSCYIHFAESIVAISIFVRTATVPACFYNEKQHIN